MKNIYRTVRSHIQKHPKLDSVILILGLAVFITITLINAPRASIWFDEAFSAYIAQFSFWDIARYTATDVHPPFYYWLLKIWSNLFGTTELAYRSLSIVFGVATATVAFFLSRKLFGRKVAWTALLFIVLSPMLIRYSDEARMYTLAALIVFTATYVMLKARQTNSTKLWVLYGVLVSLAMWTHYFTALVWVGHWVWQAMETWQPKLRFKENAKRFFTKGWIIAYSVAVGLFLPWLPFMAIQLGVVQGGGFWIGPVGVDTPTNYLSNYFYYLDHGQVQGWLALVMLAVVALLIVVLPRAFKSLRTKERRSFLLIACLAIAPPVLLFLASMPPLRSSFVERYLIPSIVALSIFLAVILVVGTRRWKPLWRALPILAVVGMMVGGITNVYRYGNFNKNTSTHIFTRQAVDEAKNASPDGTPIVAASPWIFYEAIPYSTPQHPIYFIDESTKYIYGSLNMLKDNDMHKIKDLAQFKKGNPVIWYLDNTTNPDVPPYQQSWVKLRTVTTTDDITGKSLYKATEYRVSGE